MLLGYCLLHKWGAHGGRKRAGGHSCEAGGIFGLIADHKAAILATDAAMRAYGDLEETIPACRRVGDMFGNEVMEVATDDPRWTAADAIALAMLDAPIPSAEELLALVAYAGEHLAEGQLWPDCIADDELANWTSRARNFETRVLMKAAETLRRLSARGQG
jgi:hypothetical protein